MYSYVDESGHTGPNLFDENQPSLYYGVLNSQENLDVSAVKYLEEMRKKLGVERIHANVIGNKGLHDISKELIKIQSKFKLIFDFYEVKKIDHAMISFYDQVFDSGINPAVTWSSYWTALRFITLHKVAFLFDEETLKNSWLARINHKDNESDEILRDVCKTILKRVNILPDQRSREIISDALKWAISNTRDIGYNARSKKDALQVMPNIIGFQFVMQGIAKRLLQSQSTESYITVDRQSQFNGAQKSLADYYASISGFNSEMGFGLPNADFRGMPKNPIRVSGGNESAGLELVDVYLWIFTRVKNGFEIPESLNQILRFQRKRSILNVLSMESLAENTQRFFDNIPELHEYSSEHLERMKKLRDVEENRRVKFQPGIDNFSLMNDGGDKNSVEIFSK